MNRARLLLLLTLGGLASTAHADFVTGTVVDSNGQPVAGVNITAKSHTGGGDGHLANAGTNAAGFFNCTIDAGTYEFTFEPPAPPAAVALITIVDNVVVSGTANMSTVVMDPAVHLSGRAVRAGNVPVQGVNIDVIDLASGDNLDLIGDTTNALGEFHLAVPVGSIELRFNTTPVLTPLLAPTAFEVATPAAVNVGDVLLQPGITVSAVAVNPSFLGVNNLDLDVRDVVTGQTLYTPGDNTDVNGFVDVVVPAGTYDFEFCPPLATNLVAKRLADVSVASTLNLGLVALQGGVRLSGVVTTFGGAPMPGTDLDVRFTSNGAAVFLCNDNTNAAGVYAVNVPTGTLDLTFTPPDAQLLGSAFASAVPVFGNTVRNAALPFCDCGQPNGAGTAGSGGFVPTLTATGGALRLGSHGWTFRVANGLGGAAGVVALGYGPSCGAGLTPTVTATTFGYSLVSSPVRAVPFRLDGVAGLAGAGSVDLQFDLPLDFTLTGTFLSARAQVRDPLSGSGAALTPYLCGALCQ